LLLAIGSGVRKKMRFRFRGSDDKIPMLTSFASLAVSRRHKAVAKSKPPILGDMEKWNLCVRIVLHSFIKPSPRPAKSFRTCYREPWILKEIKEATTVLKDAMQCHNSFSR
jgi:hypothetical protein